MANKKENLGGSHGGEELVDLMQNCDLPPPVKIFAGQEKTIVSLMNDVNSMLVGQKEEDVGVEMCYEKSSENEKLEILKALRLSQTRAREAERKVAVLSKEKDDLSNLLIQQSMQLFAYKQWVRMMEFQLSNLNKHQDNQDPGFAAYKWTENMLKDEDENKGAKGMPALVAVAICVGIAGVGFLSFF